MENKSEKIEKYKNDVVEFQEYYKYRFTFENKRIVVECGGDGNDIYRSVINKTMTLKRIIEECGDEYLVITEK